MKVMMFRLVVVWPGMTNEITKRGLGVIKRIDEVVGAEVNHASFPNVYKDGYTSPGSDGHFVQQWDLLIAGNHDRVESAHADLTRISDELDADGCVAISSTVHK